MAAQFRVSGDAPQLRDLMPAMLGKSRNSLACYSSPEALATHAESTPQSSCWGEGAWTNSEKFAGTPSMGAAIKLAREGWREGADRVARLRDKINAANPSAPRLARWDVAGAYPSVARAVSGNPMHMRRLTNTDSRKRPVITLLSDMSANAMVGAKCLTNRAAVVAAIVDVIESAGYAVHVICFGSSMANGVHQVCAVTVKESDQPADIGRMAFALGHASMFRRLSWVPIVEDKFTQDIGYALGCSQALNATDKPDTYMLASPNDNSKLYNSEDIAATRGLTFLLDSLAQQGCPAFANRLAA